MMSRFSFLRIGGGAVLLLIAGSSAEAQHATLYVGTVPSATGNTRELVCRGKPGIDLRIEKDPSPRRADHVAMVLRYERPREVRSVGQVGMGTVDYGRSVQFIPGSCTWNSGGFEGVPLEPGVVYFDLPRDAQTHAGAGQRDTTVNAAVAFPDLVSLPRYLSDSSRFWLFYVNDLTNVSISFRSSELVTQGSTGYVAGSLRDAAPGSATLSSANVMTGDSAARRPSVAPAPTSTSSVAGALRDKAPGTATTTAVRPPPVNDAARRTAPAPSPAPSGSVGGPLRPGSSGTAATTPVRTLPTDSAARRSAAVRTPTPTATVAGPLRGDSMGTAATPSSRAVPAATAVKLPREAIASGPRVAQLGISNVRIEPGPLGVRLTFTARIPPRAPVPVPEGDPAPSNPLDPFQNIRAEDLLPTVFDDPTTRIRVQFSRARPSRDERESRWFYPAGWNSPWFAPIRMLPSGEFLAEPYSKLEAGQLYYYLITVSSGDPAMPDAQRTGSFTADLRTPLNGLISK